MNAPARVAPGLFLSSAYAEQDIAALQQAGITHIVQVGVELKPSHPDSFTYLHIQVHDRPNMDILSHFPAAFSFIDSAIEAGGAALVHCLAGVSRSATIVLGYQLYKLKTPLEEALRTTLRARPIILPNHGFICQLLEYEQMGYDLTNWPGWGFDRWIGHPLAAQARELHKKVMGGGRRLSANAAGHSTEADGELQHRLNLLSAAAAACAAVVKSSDSPFAQLMTAGAAAGDDGDDAALKNTADSAAVVNSSDSPFANLLSVAVAAEGDAQAEENTANGRDADGTVAVGGLE